MEPQTKLTMSVQEARECIIKINSNLLNTRALILDLYEREGWSTLGYKSWRECVTTEFQDKQSYLYYQLKAAQIERNVSTNVENKIPEGQLRPLSSLTPPQQKEAWKKAVDTAPEGKVTAKHVEEVVEKMQGKESNRQPETRGDSKNLSQLKFYWGQAGTGDHKKFRVWLRGQKD